MPGSVNPLVSSGVTTAGNLIGAGLNRLFGKDAAKEQFEYNKQLIAEQYKYNNPQRQMADYRAAGINPYAALGNNTSVSGSSVGQAPTPDLSSLGTSAVAAYQGSYPLQSERDLRLAEARQVLSQERLNLASEQKIAAETKSQHIQNSILENTQEDAIRIKQAEASLVWAQMGREHEQAIYYNVLSRFEEERLKNYPQEFKQRMSQSLSEVSLNYARGLLSRAEAKAAFAQASLTAAEEVGVRWNNKFNHAVEDELIEGELTNLETLKQALQKAVNENDWNTYNQILNGFRATGEVLNGAYNARTGRGSLKLNSRPKESVTWYDNKGRKRTQSFYVW